MSCAAHRLDAGAYVLGSLDSGDLQDFQRHLSECPTCRDEVAGLARLPALLGRLRDDPDPDALAEPPSDLLLPRLLAAAVHRRRLRRRVLTVAASVATLAIVGGLRGGVLSPRPARPALAASAVNGPVRAHADVRVAAGGSQISLTLGGVPAGQQCRLVAVARDGHSDVAGSWRADYDGEARLTGTSAIGPADLADLRVVTVDGRLLLDLPVPAS